MSFPDLPAGVTDANMKTPLIVAYGGGANSSAMLIEMKRRRHIPDLILFADTGGERPETYVGVEQVSEWCVRNGFPKIITVVHTFKGQPETLENACLRKRMLPSIAYGFKSCSLKHKVEPQNHYANQWKPAMDAWKSGRKCVKAIGYDASEERRAKIRSDDKYEYWYPLIDWNIYREDCVAICKSEGLEIGKSSCFFCPSMKRREIVALAKEHPDLAARAIAMEENAELTSVKGLGRSFSWKEFLANEAGQCRLFPDHEVPEVPCGCYDGGADD